MKMKKVYLWVIILSCSFIVACVDKPKDTQDGLPFVIDFEQCITNARNINISDIADTIELIELKTPEELPVSVINKICAELKCQPGDIMEYIPDEE